MSNIKLNIRRVLLKGVCDVLHKETIKKFDDNKARENLLEKKDYTTITNKVPYKQNILVYDTSKMSFYSKMKLRVCYFLLERI